MWKLVALASLVLALALGSLAEAKCGVCIDKVTAEITGATSHGNDRTVRLVVSGGREYAEAVAPDGGTAVIMQIDGNPTKCLTLALTKSSDEGGVIAYAGTFASYARVAQGSYEGRLEIGGNVYQFRVATDGTPGKVTLLDVTAPPVLPRPVTAPAPVAPAAPVSQAVTIDEVPAPAPAGTIFDRLATPDGTGWMLALAVVAFLGATVLIERRGSRQKTTESALEA